MKNKRNTRSGFFTWRTLAALALVAFSAWFALAALNAESIAPGKAGITSRWLSRIASVLHLDSFKQVSTRGGASAGPIYAGEQPNPTQPNPSAAAAPADPAPQDFQGVRPVLSHALRDMPKIFRPPPFSRGIEPIRPPPPTEEGGPDLGFNQTFPGEGISAPSPAPFPSPNGGGSNGQWIEGIGSGLNGFVPNVAPPDVEGHVGTTQYVPWNNSSFAVWNTNGTLLYGPVAGNTLFQALGGDCALHNDGDPIVNFDILSGRWVLSQFVVGGSTNKYSHQCIAVSKSQDATGEYYLYDFVTDTTNFVDYPHIGVWPDGYYMTTHVFNAAGTAQVAARVYVFERP